MAEAIDTIHKDHANLAKLLDAVERRLAVFDAGDRPDYDIVQGTLDYCLNYPDLYHHSMEDATMRRLRARDPAAAEAVGDLAAEHMALNGATRRFAATIEDVPREIEVPRDALVAMAPIRRSAAQKYRNADA